MRGGVDTARRSRWPLLVASLALVGGLLWWLRGCEGGVESSVEVPATDGIVKAYTGPRERPPPTLDLRNGALAAIIGTVTDLHGLPIADARVCATVQTTRLPSRDVRRAMCVQSGRDGRYRIDELFPVRYAVVASAAGHIPARYQRDARHDYVDLRGVQEAPNVDIRLEGGGVEIHGTIKDLSGGPIESAQVTAGWGISFSDAEGRFSAWVRQGPSAVLAQADGYAQGVARGLAPGHVFEVFLTPEAVLTGKVVRADDGSPVEGVGVSVWASGFGGGPSVFSDAGGGFRIDGLQPGYYKVYADADDVVGQADEQVILGLGETSAPIVVKVHPAFHVEGAIVVAGGGDECEDGRLVLSERVTNRTIYGTLESDGALRARGVLPGDYEVQAVCTGFVAEERYPKVLVVDRSVTGLRWPVTRGQAIRGVVVDAGGRPVPWIGLFANPKADPGQPGAHQTSTGGETDERGSFDLAGLLPGNYAIDVRSDSRATPVTPLEVTLPQGQDLDHLRIELPGTGEVKGTVRDANGKPVAKAEVSLHNGAQDQSTYVADDGSFSFPHVAAGEYRLTASRGRENALRAPGTGDDDVQGEKVTVRTGGVEHVNLIVEGHQSKISGIVRDADGARVADAFIDAMRESTSAAKATGGAIRDGRWASLWGTPHLTDQEGRFVIEGLADAKHTVLAYRKGGGEAIPEHVEPGGEIVLTIAVTGRMSGVVTTRGGAAPEEFRVTVIDERTGFRRNDSFFRTGGAWSLAELPAGKYKVRVKAGVGSTDLLVDMVAGQDTTGVRIELAPRVSVRGVVTNLEGEPVAGMMVTVEGAGGSGNVTDAAGRYEVEHAPTGKTTVRAGPRNGQDSPYDGSEVSVVIEASGAAVELPPIRVSKRRLERGEAGGDFGHTYREVEPGADPMRRRFIVAVVRPGSPAAAAGLTAGDEVVSIDGKDVTGPNAYLLGSMTRVPPGTTVNFGLASGKSVAITADARP